MTRRRRLQGRENILCKQTRGLGFRVEKQDGMPEFRPARAADCRDAHI